MRKLRITAALLLVVALVVVTACNPLGESTEEVEQYVAVEKGDLLLTISGSGNIKVAEEANLSFGSGGRIAKIYVEEGDLVAKGEVLAELDVDSLKLARDQAGYALTQAELALTQAELGQKTAEYELDKMMDQKDTLELALFRAQIDVRSAEHHLDETRDIYTWPEIEVAEREVENAEAFLQYVLDQELPTATITYAQLRLDAAQAKLDTMIQSYDTEEVAIARMQLEATQRAEVQAQKNLDELGENIAIKELQVEAARAAVTQASQAATLAGQALEQAEKDLREAAITAPFDGTVARVTAEEGDMIPSPTMSPRQIINLIDPAVMELVVEVDEIDIPEVTVGQEATVTLDALPDSEFTGMVTTIYPVPQEVGGVIVYNVKLKLNVPEGSGVMVGMSAEADIILAKRSDVLLVPDRAISRDREGNTVVNVVTGKNKLEERPVVVGISDGFNTEIVSGLQAGETVLAAGRRR